LGNSLILVEGGTDDTTETAPLLRFTPLGELDFTFLFLANSDGVGHQSRDKRLGASTLATVTLVLGSGSVSLEASA